jgi:prevent-host-death family protein
MPQYLTITEARKRMLELPEQLGDDGLIITKRGKPVMAAMSFEQFENLMETLEILSDREFAEQLRASLAQADKGESIGLDEVEAQLTHSP